jgi:type IV pilus assembly protein PilF
MKQNIVAWFLCVFAAFFVFSCASKKDILEQQKLEIATTTRNLGQAYLAEGKNAAAYKQLKKAEALNPDDPHTHFALGVFYYRQENYTPAISEYKKTLELKPDYASARNNLGIVYLALKDWDSAITCFKDVLDNYIYATPHFPLYLLGQAYYNKKEYRSSVKYFKEALKMKPDYVFAMHWLGRTYLKMGKASKAEEILEKAVQQFPDIAEVHYYLGITYQELRKYKKAFGEYEKVAGLAPESPIADKAEKRMKKISGLQKRK